MVVKQVETETAARPALSSPIVELRRYTLRPGKHVSEIGRARLREPGRRRDAWDV